MRTNCLVFAATCLCVLVAVNGVTPLDADEAPEDLDTDAPETEAPATPAPLPEEVAICEIDEDCRTADPTATCDATGGCVCSAGFEPVTVDDVLIRDCFPSDADPTNVRSVTQNGTFPNGEFAQLTAAIRARFVAKWEQVMGVNVTSAFFIEGSVLYVFGFKATNSQLAGISKAKPSLIASIEQDPAMAAVLKPSTLQVKTTTAVGTCFVEHASRTSVLKSVCVAVECQPGYVLFVAGSGTQICIAARVDDSDDDLSDGAIAGIVIGSVLAVLVVVGVLVFVCLAMKKANAPAQENMNVSPAHKSEAPVPPTAPNEAGNPAMDQSAAGLSIYNAPYGGGDMEADPRTQSQLLVSSTAQIES
ncbi:hypothetical protein DIPPA_05132 [Diplonema papillatum]|nr:hypothetical protein DIPPA_05132 [Diplonema papillatum]